jgi:hypothetical protein
MDPREEEEFEQYLRQFQFRPPRELPAAAPFTRRPSPIWAAAALILAAVLSVGLWRMHRHAVPNTARVETPAAPRGSAEEPLLTLGQLYAAGDDRADKMMDRAAVTMLPPADRGAFRILARD